MTVLSDPSINWTNALRMEMRVSQICRKAQDYGWLIDRDRLAMHLDKLDSMIAELDNQILPRIPAKSVPKEAKLKTPVMVEEQLQYIGWVKSPFLKSTAWSKSVVTWAKGLEKVDEDHTRHLESGMVYNWSVGGPFSRVAFEKISLTSDKQVKEYLLSIGWEPTEWNFSKKTGKVTSPKLTEDSFDSIKDDTGKLIAQHIKCHHRKGQMVGWLNAIRPDGRISPIMLPQSCPTVRMSHKVIVNVPSPEKKAFFAEEMREIFTAAPGYVLMGCDAASCQLRMLCHYMGDDDYTEVVINGDKDKGTDMHTINMKLAGLPTRGHAKNFIYGFLFGAGATKVGKLIGKDARAGQKIIDQFLDGLPKLKALREGLLKAWKDRGYLIGADGRKIYVRKQHELLCYLLQSAEAILVKTALCILEQWIKIEQLDAHLVIVMHDEYNYEVREDHAERLAYLAAQAMLKAGEMLKLNVPTPGEPAIGMNWKEVH